MTKFTALLYGYDNLTNLFMIEVNGTDYAFEYSMSTYSAKNFRIGGKIVARTYKGFKTKLGLTGNSANSNILVTEIQKAKKVLGSNHAELNEQEQITKTENKKEKLSIQEVRLKQAVRVAIAHGWDKKLVDEVENLEWGEQSLKQLCKANNASKIQADCLMAVRDAAKFDMLAKAV